MSYVNSVLQPGERVVVRGHLHWIVYGPAILILVLGLGFAIFAAATGMSRTLVYFACICFAVLFIVAFLRAWYIRWITEIAVTDRRVIYKQGFLTRHTVEINMDKVASVDVDQTLLGRLLDYGTVQVIGTGGSQSFNGPDGTRGIKDLDRVASPLTLRSAITAK